MWSRAAFLDRDGTISEDVAYCSRVEDFHLLPTVPEAICLLNQSGFKVVVVTNQSGIARGYFTEETLARIHARMKKDLAEHGAMVDAIYYCPHHPDRGCNCRKPGTGLLVRAAQDMKIDLRHSYMIGDVRTDLEAGRAAGCSTALVTTGLGGGVDITDFADYAADSLIEAATWAVSHARCSVSATATRAES